MQESIDRLLRSGLTGHRKRSTSALGMNLVWIGSASNRIGYPLAIVSEGGIKKGEVFHRG
jgi:hypothetical protein